MISPMENAVQVLGEPEALVLTKLEDDLALAFVDCGGNVALTGEAMGMSAYEIRREIMRPHIAARIKQLTEVVTQSQLISIGSHLIELANIRDMAKKQGQLKVALAAERSRGEAVGIYAAAERSVGGKGGAQVAVQVNFVSKHDVNI